MRLFHISHIDLDGYSCQMVTDHFFDDAYYYNANYGKEVTARIEEVESDIKALNDGTEVLLLITDVNITKEECALVEQIVSRFNFLGVKVEIQLLDHHITGRQQASGNAWYHLDESRCATLLTLEYCKKRFPQKEIPDHLAHYVDAVNAFDLWKTDHERFEFGKVLNRIVVDAKEVNKMLFREHNVKQKVALLKRSYDYIDGNRYIELDDSLLQHKKAYLSEGAEHDTLDNLVSRYVTDLLNIEKERLTIYYGDYKGVLTYQVGNTSVLGNSFLKANPDYHFFMDVSPNGNVSLRADNLLDVSQMAVKLFGGGGHKNAAGGRMGTLRDFFDYKRLKAHVQNYITEKNGAA